MSIFNLKTCMENISKKWNYKLDEVAPGVWRMDVALKQKDDTWRYQYVWAWIIPQRHYGKDVVYMNSRCGEYDSGLNHYQLLKESGAGTFASVTVTTDKRADGTPCETVICQAVCPVHLAHDELIDEMMYDVAFGADYIENHYFGGDKN